MKWKIYLEQQLLKDTFAEKRCGKILLVLVYEEEVYKVLTNKEFTNETDSLFEKVEPHKGFFNKKNK